jgi:hypothetical protein
MNINISIKCETCGEPTNCRIGMSNREVQPFRFCCQTCGSPIDITLRANEGATLVGAVQLPEILPFDDKTNFVDLHLDFPVSFDKYVMGNTPFMMALARVDHEAMALHNARLNQLNAEESKFRTFGLLLKLYAKERLTPFKLSVQRNFNMNVRTDKPEDINAALYAVISNMMVPFAYPGQNIAAVDLFSDVTQSLGTKNRAAMKTFIDKLVDTNFLKNLQLDCLEIYPKILAAELPLRPALFLDFDIEFKDKPIPMRVSTAEFQTYKDLYKDISEIVSRQLVLVAGINNLLKRGDLNAFLPGIGKVGNDKDFTPKGLDEYADVPFGKKLDFIDDSWLPPLEGGADNQIRNAIAHFKTEYDENTQVITYFPSREGINQAKGKEISFLQFMYQLLTAYREMHRLHHLVKCLFYYLYLVPK